MSDETPRAILSYRFSYHDRETGKTAIRHVDDVTFDGDRQQLVGMEVRKCGRWSWRVKRYTLTKVTDLQRIPPVRRHGPKIGRVH